MKNILKKLIMLIFGPPVKYVISQMNLFEEVNKKIKITQELLQDAYPSTMVVNESGQGEIGKIKKIFKLPEDINMNISKNDLMFKFYVANDFTMSDAFKAYLVRTVHFVDIIEKVAERKWGQDGLSRAVPFLDFASGYGALERLLVHKIPANQVFTSDIKKQGVDFQVEQFSVNGLYSSFTPEEFNPGRKFSFIFVASLFSHLPEELFKRWLKQLWALTDENGVFVFSILSTSLLDNPTDFLYRDSSEDSTMNLVEDSIKESDKYGTAYISLERMQTLLADIGINKQQYGQYPKAFCGVQDIVVISKERNIFDNRLKFGYFDSTKY